MITNAAPAPTTIGGRTFVWGTRTFVVGVINVSPESFSGDGIRDVETALRQGATFVEQGVDILDVGGQSTRPMYSANVEASLRGATSAAQYVEIEPEEEADRVVEVIRRLSADAGVPVSVDTYKPTVARRAIDAGASMINDVWGLKRDPALARVAAEAGVPMVLMHNQDGTAYGDLIRDVCESLATSIATAREAGVTDDHIIVDPGFGFGKTVPHNLEIVRRLAEFKRFGKPIMLGSSRKSTIGHVLDEPTDRRIEGTAATVAVGIQNGVDLVRVHDVEAMTKVARMTDAIVRGFANRGGRLTATRSADAGQVTGGRSWVCLGLGSNLGDRRGIIERAVRNLGSLMRIDRVSSLYETDPIGFPDQPPFLNAAISGRTERSPQQLLSGVKDLERGAGRVPTVRNGPRSLDIDILLFGVGQPPTGGVVLRTPNLVVPHPRLHERGFVLIPLAEIEPLLVHPVLGQPVGDLAADIGSAGVRKWLPEGAPPDPDSK